MDGRIYRNNDGSTVYIRGWHAISKWILRSQPKINSATHQSPALLSRIIIIIVTRNSRIALLTFATENVLCPFAPSNRYRHARQ